MPVSISDFVKVPAEAFDATGAFDAILDVDSKLFIDPHLVRSTKAPELAPSAQSIRTRFEQVIRLLMHSRGPGDALWRQADRLITFPEMQGLCIGYSRHGTAGRGMGPHLRARMLATAKEIVDAGVCDPEIFELMGLLEEGVGADLISDMTGRIIAEDLYAYSDRIFRQFDVDGRTVLFRGHQFRLPVNRFNGTPIVLLPKDVLRTLPIARSFDEIDRVVRENSELRQRVNRIIGDEWKAATWRKKQTLRRALLRSPDLFRDFVRTYKNIPPASYDFDGDPEGQVVWYRASQEYTRDFPLLLYLPQRPTPQDVLQTVLRICQKFKDLIENNGLYTLLYADDRPKHEEAAQKLFYGIADSYCESNNLDLSREANAGRGPVDFKVSSGYEARVLVEAKLTTNQQLLHGFEDQIGEYQKAEKTQTSVYLVIDVGGPRSRVTRLHNRIALHRAAGKRVPEVVFVDARPKASASRYQSSSGESPSTDESQDP